MKNHPVVSIIITICVFVGLGVELSNVFPDVPDAMWAFFGFIFGYILRMLDDNS